jgi:hypothetical protein
VHGWMNELVDGWMDGCASQKGTEA